MSKRLFIACIALSAAWLAPFATRALESAGSVGTDATARPAWVERLETRLARIDDGFAGELGVHVRDLDSGAAAFLRADEPWYLASGVKVPVAIAAIRQIEEGRLALESRIVLEESDYVDGAGATNSHRPGTPLRVDYLIEQMLIHSDNTATDMLIRQVGLERVNAVAQELLSPSCGLITTLADVRRHVYGHLHGNAFQLSGNDLLALRRTSHGPARVERLTQLLGIARSELLLPDIDSAFDAYYASNLNAAPLSDYATMLAAIAEGHALAPQGTGYLLDVLARVETGKQRVRAGLPKDVVFAHKTGTQHRRVCDFGIALARGAEQGRRVVIVACTRGAVSLRESERALRAVGEAVTQVGLFERGSQVERSGT